MLLSGTLLFRFAQNFDYIPPDAAMAMKKLKNQLSLSKTVQDV